MKNKKIMTESIKKTFKLILVLLPLALLAIMIFLIFMVISIYKTNPDYGFALSQKIRSQAYFLSEAEYNKKYKSDKNFGEFCYRFFGDELKTKKIRLSLDERKIRGTVYAEANLYGGKIDPQTLNLEVEGQPATWHWHWYNWLGLGLDKIYRQTLEEMVNSPLRVKNDISTSTIGNPAALEYKNDQYGFTFPLPQSWSGYSILTQSWEGRPVDEPNGAAVNGPEIIIRHPLWTASVPRQDIPIMIFTYAQWDLIQQEKLSLGAAPIGPSELGRNAKYIFALPARYNFSFPVGFEEVDQIIQSQALKAF